MNREIPIVEYRYEEIYPSFKAGTDEKRITSDILHRFLRRALPADPGRSAPIRVADVGSGPCDTILGYLESVDTPQGFVIRATDIGDDYAAPDGIAMRTLAAAQRAGQIRIVDFAVSEDDSFAGKLASLVSAQGERAGHGRFDLVVASHMFYHADSPAGVETLLGDAADNLLAARGILLMCHAAAPPGTFSYLRARYGRHSTRLDQSDTPAVNVGDPPRVTRDYFARRRLPLCEIAFSARLELPGLSDADWRDFAHPECYAEIVKRSPEAAENLRRLLFVTERAPLEFAADRSERGLVAYLAAACKVIESNHGSLPLAEWIQIGFRPGADPEFVTMVRGAAAAATPAS